MYTIEQVQAAHSKVKSDADFPSYISEIKELGITRYETYVNDGSIHYHKAQYYTATTRAKYQPIKIADTANTEVFKTELLAHQQGKTGQLSFIKMCAETGIEKWETCMEKMTRTYYDKSGNKILEEQIFHI